MTPNTSLGNMPGNTPEDMRNDAPEERPPGDAAPATPDTLRPGARPRGHVLAVGFGVTTAVWLIGYVSLMQPGLLVGEALFALMLLAMLAGGVVIGRYAGGGWQAGAAAGALAGLLNIMIVGGLIGDTSRPLEVALWLGGNFLVPAALGAIGAAVGRRFARPLPADFNWYGVFTKLAAATVFLLLVSGGIVTGWEAGLAVPDWPQSFGHNMILYPLAEMITPEAIEEGVHYEHAHRLYGMLVGMMAIMLLVTLPFYDKRRWPAVIAAAILVMVIIQGILGGTRVTKESLVLALGHGVFGQVIFAAVACVAAVTSTTWHRAAGALTEAAPADRKLSVILLGLLLVQLLLGASFRHLKFDESAAEGMVTGLLHSHLLFAFVVAAMAVIVGIRARALHHGQPVLPLLGVSLLVLIVLQLGLGFAAWVVVLAQETGRVAQWVQVIVTTSHQATGAVILATASLIAVWVWRLLRPTATPDR